MIRYLTRIADTNLKQREEEGVDTRVFQEAVVALQDVSASQKIVGLIEILEELESAPVRADFGYNEPNDFQGIRELACPVSGLPEKPDEDTIRDKVLGGWLGRAAGCRLGRPIEGTPLGFKKEQVRQYLENRGLWPIPGYFDTGEPMCAIDPALPRPFPGMIRDDDIDYVILNLLMLEMFGFDWTHDNAREIWCRHLSHDFIYAAGKAAYSNFCIDFNVPQTATWGNPCRQSLGAMIRCDTWGWVCPGEPIKAAELAYRDAVISQTTNGIYAGMFFAAIIAAAFVESDIQRLVEVGLSQVPKTSRFAEAIEFTMSAWNEHGNWNGTIDSIYERYGNQYFNHAVINACIVILGLLSGAGDFERTIIDTVVSGFDADCTGATAGSIAGVILGGAALPAKWVEPLNDTYETFLAALGVQKFSNLAERTAVLAVQSHLMSG
jgi:ADP-ribosylglycohydrolase